MIIASVEPVKPSLLRIRAQDGRCGVFDVQPYLQGEAFRPLCEWGVFANVRNGGYYVEWDCGADLSADTIEMKLATDGLPEREMEEDNEGEIQDSE